MRARKLYFLVFIVKPETHTISKNEIRHDKIGDAIQDIRMIPIYFQLSASILLATVPAPSIAPTTVCVPEMGMPEADENMIKQNEARQTANIIRSLTSISSVLIFLMIS